MDRKLNDEGVHRFEAFVRSLRQNGRLRVPYDFLNEKDTSQPIGDGLDFDDVEFGSRYECAVHVAAVMSNVDGTADYYDDRGFWSALALYWFDQLCPASASGIRKPSREYNFVPSTDHRHYQRHAIRTSWQLVSMHGENAKFLLGKPMHVRGELTEQFMGRQDYLSCSGVMECANRLYLDRSTGSFKKGAGGRKSPGCIARFIVWLQQIEQTYDIFSIDGNELFDMLPAEFERFRMA